MCEGGWPLFWKEDQPSLETQFDLGADPFGEREKKQKDKKKRTSRYCVTVSTCTNTRQPPSLDSFPGIAFLPVVYSVCVDQIFLRSLDPFVCSVSSFFSLLFLEHKLVKSLSLPWVDIIFLISSSLDVHRLFFFNCSGSIVHGRLCSKYTTLFCAFLNSSGLSDVLRHGKPHDRSCATHHTALVDPDHHKARQTQLYNYDSSLSEAQPV